MRGKRHTPTSIEAMKQAKRGKYKGVNNPMFGRSHNSDSRSKISSSRKGSKWMHDPFTGVQKSVKMSDVDTFISKGWKLGRK